MYGNAQLVICRNELNQIVLQNMGNDTVESNWIAFDLEEAKQIVQLITELIEQIESEARSKN